MIQNSCGLLSNFLLFILINLEHTNIFEIPGQLLNSIKPNVAINNFYK